MLDACKDMSHPQHFFSPDNIADCIGDFLWNSAGKLHILGHIAVEESWSLDFGVELHFEDTGNDGLFCRRRFSQKLLLSPQFLPIWHVGRLPFNLYFGSTPYNRQGRMPSPASAIRRSIRRQLHWRFHLIELGLIKAECRHGPASLLRPCLPWSASNRSSFSGGRRGRAGDKGLCLLLEELGAVADVLAAKWQAMGWFYSRQLQYKAIMQACLINWAVLKREQMLIYKGLLESTQKHSF